MSDGDNPDKLRKPLFTRNYEKRSLGRWIVPLVVILVIIIFLPRLMDLLLPQ